MKKENFLSFTDDVKFSLMDPNLIKIKDDYEGAFKNDPQGQLHHTGMGTVSEQSQNQQTMPQGLLVRIAATHAGIITRNNGFYLPDKMKKGASSFTDNYPKPVLLHHDDEKDPVGRIHQARYMDTSGAIADAYGLAKGLPVRNKHGREVGIITDTLIKDFCNDKMPFGMQVDTILTLLKDSLLEDAGYSGLGYIDLVANITDREAIAKLLDGRYLTGSVGATTDQAVCSICRQDWTEDGKCEHTPGGIYDSSKCFIIAGNLSYDEYSWVNKPADRHSKVLELNYNGIQDSIETINDYKGRIYEVQLSFPQYDSVSEEERMTDKIQDVSKETPDLVIEDSATATPPAEDNVQGGEQASVEDKVVENAAEQQDDSAEKDSETIQDNDQNTIVEDNTEESLDDFLTRVLDAEELSDEDESKLYEMMWDELKEDSNLEDAKLSTEKRKKLASSTFCGPNRSFPVPDCAHVTAARRLIGRYKGPGNKSEILECVARKAKALGCGSSKDAVQPVEDSKDHSQMLRIILATIEQDHEWVEDSVLTDEEVGTLRNILKRMATMVGKDTFTQAAIDEGLSLVTSNEKALEDEIIRNEETIGELRDSVDAIRKEYKALLGDMETLQDSLVEEKLKTRKSKEAHLVTLISLRDQKIEEKDFSELEDTAVDLELEQILKAVDMTKITDKLGDGMARVPTGEVESPVAIQDETKNQKRVSLQDLAAIEETFHKLLLTHGREVAEAFIQRKQAEGILPVNGDE